MFENFIKIHPYLPFKVISQSWKPNTKTDKPTFQTDESPESIHITKKKLVRGNSLWSNEIFYIKG